MPQAPRTNKKATKVAYKILGKPLNMDDQEPYKYRSTQKKLEFESWYPN